MSEFDALQATIQRHAATRREEQLACETFLNALYHALRGAGGPGQPLYNVTLEMVADPLSRLRPAPARAYYAAWFRLGLCEVLVRVRRLEDCYQGEYGQDGSFILEEVSAESIIALSRQILRDVADSYNTDVPETPSLPFLN